MGLGLLLEVSSHSFYYLRRDREQLICNLSHHLDYERLQHEYLVRGPSIHVTDFVVFGFVYDFDDWQDFCIYLVNITVMVLTSENFYRG